MILYFSDDSSRPVDSSGSIIAPTGHSFQLSTGKTVTLYNTLYCSYTQDSDNVNASLIIDCFAGYDNYENSDLIELVELMFSADVCEYDTSKGRVGAVINTYSSDPCSPQAGGTFTYYDRNNRYRRYTINTQGFYRCRIGIDLPVNGRAYAVRINTKQRRNGGSWYSCGSVTYVSYAPFAAVITNPASWDGMSYGEGNEIYINGVNEFAVEIDEQYESVIEYEIKSGNTGYGCNMPVRTSTAPYITSGQKTTALYWYPQIETRTFPDNLSYRIVLRLFVPDPGDPDYKLEVSKTSIAGSATHLDTYETSMFRPSFTIDDPSGLYDKYGVILRNTDAKIRCSATVDLYYGAEATILYRDLATKDNLVLYSGKESGSWSNVQNVPSTGNTVNQFLTLRSHINDITTETFSANIVDYYTPSFPNIAVHRCDSDGTQNDNGAYCLIEWTVSICPIANKNSKKLTISTPSGNSELTLSNYYQGGSMIVPASTESSYDITFTASDDLKSFTRTLRLSTSGVIIDFLRGGKGVAFGKVASYENAVEVSQDWDLICYKMLISGTDVNKWMSEMLSRMRAVEQYLSNVGSTDQFEVTFYNGPDLVDRQWVRNGEDADNPYITPEKESTNTESYSFAGWALEDGKTTANPDALRNITSYRSIYAAFQKSTRYYTVTFFGTSTVTRSVTYTANAETPELPSGSIGYSPTGMYVTKDIECKPVYYTVTEISDDWDQIIESCEDGTYAEKYKIGQYKDLDLGSQGVVRMQYVASKADLRADKYSKASMTWISNTLLSTNKRYNPSLESSTEKIPVDESWVHSSSTNYWDSQNSGTGSIARAKWDVTITPNTSLGYLRINYKSNSSTCTGTLKVVVDGSTVVNNAIAKDFYSSWASYNVLPPVSSKTVYEVEAVFTAKDDIRCTVSLDFAGVEASKRFHNTLNDPTTALTTVYTEGTGGVGGWASSELRAYLNNNILNLVPTNVRKGIKPVKKFTIYCDRFGKYKADGESSDYLWIPSSSELYGHTNYENKGPEYASNSSSRIKRKNNTATSYFLRSPNLSIIDAIYSSGNKTTLSANNTAGVCIGFCT